MKNRRVRAFVLGLALFTLVLTGVYALLAANLTITGTATGTGDFKIEFTNVASSNTTKATTTLNDDRTSLSIDTNLSYPGDTVTVDFTIQNTGSLAATVNSLIINENSTTDFTIVINGLSAIEGTTLAVGGTTQGSVVITWEPASTNTTPTPVNFDVTIDYVQATT